MNSKHRLPGKIIRIVLFSGMVLAAGVILTNRELKNEKPESVNLYDINPSVTGLPRTEISALLL